MNKPLFYIYDKETMLNCYLFGGKFVGDNKTQIFELSSRINQRNELLSWLSYLQSLGVIMVGFNNLHFDYPILHDLLTNPYLFSFERAYQLAQQIIHSQDRFGGDRIRFGDRIIPQLDLMKVHHFDNRTKATSLKALQFAMRLEDVDDLPFPYDQPLEPWQMDRLRVYLGHDLGSTEQFFYKSELAIKIRQELLEQGVLSGDVLNYSDVKLGTEYLVRKIGRQKCYVSGSTPRQTIRKEVRFSDVIVPRTSFRTEPFAKVLEWFNAQKIYPNAEERPRLETNLAGLQFHFGVGGVHASVNSQFYETTETHVIKDVDVAGMYPAVAIANGFAPEHLGQDFVQAYRQLSVDRKQYPKGTAMNLLLKLAGNGVSGNLENQYSPFFDVKCAYQIRINGQLQLIQLAELLHMIPGVQLIQANTDGVTALVPRDVEHFFDLWCNEWEVMTNLKLEHASYKRMWIRDVNNYIAEYANGSLKRKGAYWYPTCAEDYQGSSGSNWNKDFSNLAAQKGIEAALVRGIAPEFAVKLMSDPFDFMLRYKTPGGAKVYIGDKEQQRTVRYYVSRTGQPMRKVSKPKGSVGSWKKKNGITNEEFARILREIPAGSWDARIHTKNKSQCAENTTGIEKGFLVRDCNKASEFNWNDVDYSYYIEEINKLMIGTKV